MLASLARRFAQAPVCTPRAPARGYVEPGYTRTLLRYPSGDGDAVTAYLLVPKGDGPFPAVLVHHQHNSDTTSARADRSE